MLTPTKRELQHVVDEFPAEVEVNKARNIYRRLTDPVKIASIWRKPSHVLEDVTRHDVMVKFMGALRSQNLG